MCPTDLHPSQAPHLKTFNAFLIYLPQCQSLGTIQSYSPKPPLNIILPEFIQGLLWIIFRNRRSQSTFSTCFFLVPFNKYNSSTSVSFKFLLSVMSQLFAFRSSTRKIYLMVRLVTNCKKSLKLPIKHCLQYKLRESKIASVCALKA